MNRTVQQLRDSAGGLLTNRNFVLLWCAYAISAFGDHLSEMAILRTQDALNKDVDITPLSARMTFMFFLPFFLFGPFMGLLADRFPRRRIMVTADVVRAVIMFFFAALIAFTQDLGRWGPFIPLFVVGIFAASFSPSRQALLPTIVRPQQLVRANGMIAGLGIISTMAAILVGGYLADQQHIDVKWIFRTDAATFVASAVLLLWMRPPAQHVEPGEATLRSAVRKIVEGLHYARTHRRVRELIAVAAVVWFCGPLVNSVLAAVVRDVYHGQFSEISSYRAFLGLGFILGAGLITLLGPALRSELAIIVGLFGVSFSILVFASSVFLDLTAEVLSWIGAVGITLAGMSGVSTMAGFSALLQRIVPDRIRGRIFGVTDLVSMGASLTATGALGIPTWTRVDRWVGYILVAVAVVTFATALTGGVWTVRRRRPLPAGLAVGEYVNELLVKFWYRMERIGPPRVPRTGPVIITANHTCAADPLFLLGAAPYRIFSFIIAAEYMRLPIARWFIEWIECIPVRRDSRDTSAPRQAMRYLEAGKAVAIFIQGGITDPCGPPRIKDGVALLALKTGAPVVPAHISGTVFTKDIFKGLFSRHRATVRFGPPVDLSEFRDAPEGRETLRAASEKIYRAIMALAPDGGEAGAPPSDGSVIVNSEYAGRNAE